MIIRLIIVDLKLSLFMGTCHIFLCKYICLRCLWWWWFCCGAASAPTEDGRRATTCSSRARVPSWLSAPAAPHRLDPPRLFSLLSALRHFEIQNYSITHWMKYPSTCFSIQDIMCIIIDACSMVKYTLGRGKKRREDVCRQCSAKYKL